MKREMEKREREKNNIYPDIYIIQVLSTYYIPSIKIMLHVIPNLGHLSHINVNSWSNGSVLVNAIVKK